MLTEKLNFKQWVESIFGRGILDDPEPASNAPNIMAKIYGGAYPSYDPESLPHQKAMKRTTMMKKSKKH